MDTVECNCSTFDLEAEIAKTAEMIQKLLEAEGSINKRMNTILNKQYKIGLEINRSRDEVLQLRICNLRAQITSMQQFPYNKARRFYYHPGLPMRRQRSPSPSARELAKPVQKLNSEFHHKCKSLASERRMAKEIQQREKKVTDLKRPLVEADTNMYFSPWRCRRRKPLPTKDVKELIRIWAKQVAQVSILILRDSKNSIAPPATADELDEVNEFGRRFYEEMNISRAEFKQQWDAMKDVKNSIERIIFDLNKARMRHERGYTMAEELREKASKIDELVAKARIEMRVMRSQKSYAHRYMLKLRKKKKEFVGHSS